MRGTILRACFAAALTASALARPARAGEAAANGPLTAPILLYHHVGAPRAGRYSVTAAQLADQLRWLRDQGYRPVSVDDIGAALSGGRPLPARAVAITFDDGWRDQYVVAAPILEKYGFRATFFVVSGWVGGGALLMSWPEIRDLAARGHWIGSHSALHKNMAGLADVSLAHETLQSRAAISREVGAPPAVFAYPLGVVDARAERTVRNAGYAAAVSVTANPRQTTAQQYRLNRIEMRGAYTIDNLAAWLLAGVERAGPAPRAPWWQAPAPLIPPVAPPRWWSSAPEWLLEP